MFKCIVITLFFSVCYIPLSQVPFANALQVPLLLNPAFAGNKDKHRVALAWNRSTAHNSENQAYTVSYDNFSAKGKLGYGVYGLYTMQDLAFNKVDYSAQRQYFDHKALKKKLPDQLQYREVGICMSTKHLYEENTQNRATFSPSIGLSIGEFGGVLIGDFYKSVRSKPDSTNHIHDSLAYTRQVLHGTKMEGQVGLKYNTHNFMIMYMAGLSLERGIKVNQRWSSTPNDHIFLFEKASVSVPYRYIRIYHRLSVGYSYPYRSSSKSSITLLGSVGMLNSRFKNNDSHDEYSNYKDAIPHVDHLHGSAVYRYSFVLASLSYTKFGLAQTYGFGAGLQKNKYRVMATYFPPLQHGVSTMELALNLYL